MFFMIRKFRKLKVSHYWNYECEMKINVLVMRLKSDCMSSSCTYVIAAEVTLSRRNSYKVVYIAKPEVITGTFSFSGDGEDTDDILQCDKVFLVLCFYVIVEEEGDTEHTYAKYLQRYFLTSTQWCLRNTDWNKLAEFKLCELLKMIFEEVGVKQSVAPYAGYVYISFKTKEDISWGYHLRQRLNIEGKLCIIIHWCVTFDFKTVINT